MRILILIGRRGIGAIGRYISDAQQCLHNIVIIHIKFNTFYPNCGDSKLLLSYIRVPLQGYDVRIRYVYVAYYGFEI